MCTNLIHGNGSIHYHVPCKWQCYHTNQSSVVMKWIIITAGDFSISFSIIQNFSPIGKFPIHWFMIQLHSKISTYLFEWSVMISNCNGLFSIGLPSIIYPSRLAVRRLSSISKCRICSDIIAHNDLGHSSRNHPQHSHQHNLLYHKLNYAQQLSRRSLCSPTEKVFMPPEEFIIGKQANRSNTVPNGTDRRLVLW